MKHNKANLFQSIHYDHLGTISGIKFTPREIDVIACLLGGRSTKTVAQFLSIEEKTVETHKYNVMRKLECNSKESVINFIEKSDKLPVIKKHYLGLLSKALFEKSLQEISKLNIRKNITCSLVYWQDQESKALPVDSLKKHLQTAGFKVSLEVRENYKSLNHLIHKLESEAVDSIIYMIPETLLNQLQTGENKGNLEIFPFIQKASQNPGSVIFLLDTDTTAKIPSEIQTVRYVNFEAHDNYYFSVLEILKRMIPNTNLDKAFLDFKKQYETIHGSFDLSSPPLWPEIPLIPLKENTLVSFFSRISKKEKAGLFLGGTLLLSACGVFMTFNTPRIQPYNSQNPRAIRSDLPIPEDNTLLRRPKLLKQIDDTFKEQKGIQTLALIGLGGTGKTTIARQYARQQKSPMVWEINAETQASFITSFESLAYALCQIEEEKKILKGLQEIKKSPEREDKIILFAKERLKSYSNWFLIFDNVEKFEVFQKYFPSDPVTWGMGKIIVTTRDANIQNNSHINHVIHIEELDRKEKLGLFMSIMNDEKSSHASLIKQTETEKFLEVIPPFPLDISVAAYYLKTTNIPYDQYLENIKLHNKVFEDTQEKILKETNSYAKTRYGIITLSVRRIIDTNEDFKILLLLASLLDSQNIPKDLLCTLKENVIVDSLIYHLKEHSLLTGESTALGDSIPILSIHRSTQAIMLNYFIKTLNLEKNSHLLQKISNNFVYYMYGAVDKEDLSMMKLLISHAEAFLKHHDLPLLIRGSIESELGAIYFYLGDYIKAQRLLETNFLNLDKNVLNDHSKLPRLLTHLALTCRNLGNFERSRDLLEQSLEIYNKYLPKNDAKVVRNLGYLGNIYRNLGDFQKAKALLEQSLVNCKYYPAKNIEIARNLSYLGLVHRSLGNFEKAKDYFEKSLIMYNKHFPNDHVAIAQVSAYLGIVHKNLGNFEKSRDLLERSLAIYKKHFPQGHSDIAWNLGHLGNIYRILGDYERARVLLEQSLQVYKVYISEKHTRYALSLRYLGNVYKELGDYKKAKNNLEEGLKIYKKHYGEDHVETARILQDLGRVYLSERDLDIAEGLIKGALANFERDNHPESYLCLEDLAEIYSIKSIQALKTKTQQQSDDLNKHAINYLQQALQIVKTRYPMGSPHIKKIQTKLNTLIK